MGRGTFIWETFGYEEGTRRLNRWGLQRQGVTGTDLDVRYTHDAAGNITAMTDSPTASGTQTETQCFRYDDQRRLIEAWTPTGSCTAAPGSALLGGPAPYWHTFTYDAAGNRQQEVIHTSAGDTTRSYRYGATDGSQADTLRAVTQTGTAGAKQESYTYDTAGNTLTRTREGRSQDLAWDVEGRLESVTEDSQKTSYVYNAEGERLIRRDPTGTTLYLNGTEIRLAKAGGAVTGTRYYTFDERTVAARTTRGVSFFTSDQQGTAQVQVDATSMAVTRRRLTPFGQERGTAAQGWVGERGFVNGTRDDSTGLVHLGAREYDPVIGRFISVDPL